MSTSPQRMFLEFIVETLEYWSPPKVVTFSALQCIRIEMMTMKPSSTRSSEIPSVTTVEQQCQKGTSS
uniref:Uncharacterized protein n=1 Tax=Timema shepardi TaxID=629360 RepID=A0A7R9B1H8_TIMSH|nr:unnamed protein product [Timema shepardi]